MRTSTLSLPCWTTQTPSCASSSGPSPTREALVRYDPENKPGVSNLMAIYSTITGKSMEEIEAEFSGKGYGDFKPAVAEAVIEELRPIQERFRQLAGDKAYLEQCYRDNAPKAERIARKTLQKVMKKVGYLPL